MSERNETVSLATGASRGIGAEVAKRLARDGFAVVVNYTAGAEPADALVREIKQGGGRAIAARADVSDPATVKRLFDAAEAAFGGVDVLVNNAGVMTLGAVAEMDDNAFDRMVAVNLKGVFNTLREAALGHSRRRAG